MAEQVNSLSEFVIGSDELGSYARTCVDPSLYTATAIFKTAYWFTDKCYLYLGKRASMVEVEFRLKSGDSVEALKMACGEFMNNLLDQVVRQRVLEETSGIRDILLKKAFFDAKASVAKSLVSDESNALDARQSFKGDPLNISGR